VISGTLNGWTPDERLHSTLIAETTLSEAQSTSPRGTRGARDHPPAANTAPHRIATAVVSTTGSFGTIWNWNVSNRRDAAGIAGISMAKPTVAINSASPSTIDTALPRCAARATRTPISLVQRATVYAKVP